MGQPPTHHLTEAPSPIWPDARSDGQVSPSSRHFFARHTSATEGIKLLGAAQAPTRKAARAWMSNCELFHLRPVFELEQHQVREVLRILLHSIVFQRALGPVKPVERDSELFEVTWVRSGSEEERVGRAARWHVVARGVVSGGSGSAPPSRLLALTLGFTASRSAFIHGASPRNGSLPEWMPAAY